MMNMRRGIFIEITLLTLSVTYQTLCYNCQRQDNLYLLVGHVQTNPPTKGCHLIREDICQQLQQDSAFDTIAAYN